MNVIVELRRRGLRQWPRLEIKFPYCSKIGFVEARPRRTEWTEIKGRNTSASHVGKADVSPTWCFTTAKSHQRTPQLFLGGRYHYHPQPRMTSNTLKGNHALEVRRAAECRAYHRIFAWSSLEPYDSRVQSRHRRDDDQPDALGRAVHQKYNFVGQSRANIHSECAFRQKAIVKSYEQDARRPATWRVIVDRSSGARVGDEHWLMAASRKVKRADGKRQAASG